jgi:hypothetical protein
LEENQTWSSWVLGDCEDDLRALEGDLGDATDAHLRVPLTLTDNQSALDAAAAPSATKRTKHFNLRLERVRLHEKRLGWVPSLLNRADQMTKSLAAHRYEQLFCVGVDEAKRYRSFGVKGVPSISASLNLTAAFQAPTKASFD